MSKEYYFISDLHIGGDGLLQKCDFEEELIEFLKELETKRVPTELIIVGDFFGFWEITDRRGIDKLISIIKNHKKLFEQFKLTGRVIDITVIPGNHDHELVSNPKFGNLLKKYNIDLEKNTSIMRKVSGKKIWIEHGNQYDEFNKITNYKEPKSFPRGYYIAHDLVAGKKKYSIHGEDPWMKDLSSVTPNEDVPNWMFSNYFYREMNPIIRFILFPFMLFFLFSLFILTGFLLETLNILRTNFFDIGTVRAMIPFLNNYVHQIIIIDVTLVISILLFSIPFILIMKDLKITLKRFGLTSDSGLTEKKQKLYDEGVRKVFAKDSKILIYVCGHTHKPSLVKKGSHVIINTGTWIKRLRRVKAFFKILPDVYYPSYNLNYFKIFSLGKQIFIEYKKINKKIDTNLTILQKLVTLGKTKTEHLGISKRTIINEK